MTFPELRTLHLTDTPPDGETHESRKLQQLLYQLSMMGLSLRHDLNDREAIERDLLLFKEVVLELRHTPPIGLTFDLIALWRQGSQFTPRSPKPHERPYHRLLLTIQNEVFYRLLRHPRFQELQRILPTLSKQTSLPSNESDKNTTQPTRSSLRKKVQLSLFERAIVFLTSQLFRSVRSSLVSVFRPHPLYVPARPKAAYGSLLSHYLPDYSRDASPIWLEDPVWCIQTFEGDDRKGWVTSHIQKIVEEWLQTDTEEWLPSSCIPILKNMEYLKTPLQRIQWQQLHGMLDCIAPSSNLHQLVIFRDLGYRELRVPMSSTKPEGGYSGLARRGDISSLLPSELLFWDDSHSINPFFVRWVENETLFYEREQSHSHTRHRQLLFTLDITPGIIHYKAKHLPVSGFTLLVAWLARICMDLRQVCPEEVLDFHFALGPKKLWVGDEKIGSVQELTDNTSMWSEEANLLSLFLEQLPHIGANTTFQLVDEPSTYLESQPPRNNLLQLHLATPDRWTQHPSRAPLQLVITPERNPNIPPSVLQIILEELEPNLEGLANLRDHMLESILKAPLLQLENQVA